MPSLSHCFGVKPGDIDHMRVDEIVAYLHQLKSFLGIGGV